MASILDRINDPADLKGLSLRDLKQLATEIREAIIEGISQTGGHFAPGLGAVELTIALHAVLNSPKDKLVWDVGHQTYPHKLITGRRDRFHTIKQLGGISGYCRREESVHDMFEAGHGCTSISAALGYAKARDLRGTDETVAAVIGDGSLTGGLAYEALNNAGHSKTNLIVVLNDNSMSIAPNVGALSKYLDTIRAEPRYLWAKHEAESVLHRLPLGDRVLEAIGKVKDGVKQMVVPGMLFEELGLTYLGPVDGHDLEVLMTTIQQAQRIGGPVLIHAITQKGKGYAPAEKDPFTWHATSGFNPATGEATGKKDPRPTYSKVFGNTLIRLADRNPNIVAITAAMPDGTGLLDFQRVHPDRCFDVAMAEQHAVTFAAGLAIAGMRPVAAIYSTFLQRGYDQVLHDVCIQNLPVVFCMDRGGIAGDDGPTHQGVFDIAYMRPLPNMVVMAPKDETELQRMMAFAVQHDAPCAIRYPRGTGPGAPLVDDPEPVPLGVAEVLREGDDVAILGYGYGVQPALAAAQELATDGIRAMVINARFCKPLDAEVILEAARRCGRVVTIEDGVRTGGFGSAVGELLLDHNVNVPVLRLGIPDQFVEHGKREKLLEKFGLDAMGVLRSVTEFVQTTSRNRNVSGMSVGGG